MTIKEAKEELREYRWELEYISNKEKELKELNYAIDRSGGMLTLTKNRNNNYGKEKMICEKIDLENTIKELIDRVKSMRKGLEQKINKLDQPYRNILYDKYIKGKTIAEIAFDLKYSVQRIYQLLHKGIEYYSNKFVP